MSCSSDCDMIDLSEMNEAEARIARRFYRDYVVPRLSNFPPNHNLRWTLLIQKLSRSFVSPSVQSLSTISARLVEECFRLHQSHFIYRLAESQSALESACPEAFDKFESLGFPGGQLLLRFMASKRWLDKMLPPPTFIHQANFTCC